MPSPRSLSSYGRATDACTIDQCGNYEQVLCQRAVNGLNVSPLDVFEKTEAKLAHRSDPT